MLITASNIALPSTLRNKKDFSLELTWQVENSTYKLTSILLEIVFSIWENQKFLKMDGSAEIAVVLKELKKESFSMTPIIF